MQSAIKVRRGDVRRAVVVRTKKPVQRPDGRFIRYVKYTLLTCSSGLDGYDDYDAEYCIRFDDNAAVLLNNKREMLGTRIGGVVSADLRMRGWSKIVSLAPKVSSKALISGFFLDLFDALKLCSYSSGYCRLYDLLNGITKWFPTLLLKRL